MKKLILFSFVAILLQSCGDIKDEYMYDKGQYTINWNAAADSSTNRLVSEFWNTTEHYFNYGNNGSLLEFHYWPNAHAMDVVIDAYLRTNDNKYKEYFTPLFEGIKKKNGNKYLNNFYDDMEWNALTFLRLYDITKEEKYLTTAKELWTDIKTGWSDVAGGGIAWAKDARESKNACSNGPAAIIAARMYGITKDESDKEWALKIYDWEKEVLFNRSTGGVSDNINGKTGTVNTVTLTYNQGTFIGAALELYKITKDAIYLNDAQKAVNYTLSKCIDPSKNILRVEGDGDGALFKGIFVRYFLILIETDGVNLAYKTKYVNFLNNNAQMLWRNGNYKQELLFGPDWASPIVGNTQLTSQASGCMLIEAMAKFESDK